MRKLLSFVLLVVCFSLLTGCGSSGGGDGEADSSLILGTWELVKATNPDNYSDMLDVMPNDYGDRISMSFHSNGTVIGVFYEIKFYDGGATFWETQNDGSQENADWHLSGSSLTLDDSEGSETMNVKFSGNTMTWFHSTGASMVYEKVTETSNSGALSKSSIYGTWEVIKMSDIYDFSELLVVKPNDTGKRTTLTFTYDSKITGFRYLPIIDEYGVYKTTDYMTQIAGTWQLNGSTLTITTASESGSLVITLLSNSTIRAVYGDGSIEIYQKVN